MTNSPRDARAHYLNNDAALFHYNKTRVLAAPSQGTRALLSLIIFTCARFYAFTLIFYACHTLNLSGLWCEGLVLMPPQAFNYQWVWVPLPGLVGSVALTPLVASR